MDEELVTLADIAKELGLDRSAARKAIIELERRSGRKFLLRGRVRGNQPGRVLTRAAADEVLELRKHQGYTVGNKVGIVATPLGEAIMYVLGLHGGRIKIGFSDAFEQRLDAHRTIAPDLVVLRRWNLTKAYEVVMIDLARNTAGMQEVGPEVFEATEEARDALLARLDALARDVGADCR